MIEPAQDFIFEIGKRLKKLAPGVYTEQRPVCLIFLINRDIRLSKVKNTFKTHLGIWIWEGDGAKFESSGYIYHPEPPNILLGVGIHIFSKKLLKA